MGAGYLVPVESNRPANIVSLELGQIGTDHVRTCLSQNLGPLSSYIAGFVNNQGTCFAPVEDNITLDKAKQFDWGKYLPTAAIRQWLGNYIDKNWGADCQIIYEDGWMKKSDITRRPPNCPYFFFDDKPFYAPQGDATAARLDTGQKTVHSHNFAAFIVKPPLALPALGQDAPAQFKQILAQHMRAILLSAYDREGYVVWQTQK